MFSFLSAAVAAIVPIMNTVQVVCKTVAAVAMTAAAVIEVGRQVGILDPACSSRELGEQVLCAEQEGIVPENFNDPDEYIAKVRAVDVSQYDVDQWDESTKALKAIEFTCRAIAEKIGPDAAVPLNGLVQDIGKTEPFFTPERTAAYLKAGQEGELDLSGVSDYLNGGIASASRASEIRAQMIQAELTADPSADRAAIEQKIDAL